MVWYDPPTDPNDPNTSYLGQNPAIRDALMMVGAGLLSNARKPGMEGVGESLMGGFNTWAGRREQYAKEAREAALRRGELAPGHLNPVGKPLWDSTDPSLTRSYDDPNYKPVGEMTQTGPGTAPPPGWQYTPSPALGNTPYTPGARVPYVPPGAPGAPQLPQSPFGPGPWGAAAPGAAPPPTPAPPIPPGQLPYVGPSPRIPPGLGGSQVPAPRPPAPTPPPPDWQYPAWPPQPVGYPQRIPPGFLNAPGDGSAGGPFEGGTGASSLAGGAEQDIPASPVDAAATRAGMTPDERAGWGRIINRESGGRHLDAKGNVKINRELVNGKPANATGLGQLLPGTFAEMKRKYNIQGDITDEAANAEASARYYKEQLDRYGGDKRKAAMAYFAGPGNVDKGIIGPKTIAYANAIEGSQGQTTMVGGAEKDVAQTPATSEPTLDSLAPDWKRRGLLQDMQTQQAEARGQLYTPDGQLTEEAKHTLRLSLDAAGPEGFQQALMMLAQQKPETFGNEQTGMFIKYKSGLVEQVSPGKAQDQFVQIRAGDTELLKKAGLDPPPPGKFYNYNLRTHDVDIKGEKPEETFTNLGADPGTDPKTGKPIPKAPAGYTWQQKSDGQLSTIGAKPDDKWTEVSETKGVKLLKNIDGDMKTVGNEQHAFTLIKDPEEARQAIGPAYQPGMLVQKDENGRYYVEKGNDLYELLSPDQAREAVKTAYDPAAYYQRKVGTQEVTKTGGIQKQVTAAGDVLQTELAKKDADSINEMGTAQRASADLVYRLEPLEQRFTDAIRAGKGNELSGPVPEAMFHLNKVLYNLGLVGSDSNVPFKELLQATQSFLAPRARVLGSGSTSDFEVQEFRRALPGLGNTALGNLILIKGIKAAAERDRILNESARTWAKEHGTMDGWTTYMKTKDPDTGKAPEDAIPHLYTNVKGMKRSDYDKIPSGEILYKDGQIFMKD